MTLDEIFSELSAHFIKGLMFHDQMSNYFDFLHMTYILEEQKKIHDKYKSML